MKKTILLITTIFFLLSLLSISVYADDISVSCQNYPPPNYCPEGKVVFQNGTDNTGCSIWGCICMNPGETWYITPSTKDYPCCTGERIGKAEVINSTVCVAYQDLGMCSECGNNICDPWENICNCIEDCTNTATTTHSSSKCRAIDGVCCKGDQCASTSVMCVEGTSPRFLGCSDSCTPEYSCVDRDSSTSFCISMPECADGRSPIDTGIVDSDGCKRYECEKEEIVCCESFGYGANMIKTASTYSLMPKSKCSVCENDVTNGISNCISGGGRNIVANSYCEKEETVCCRYFNEVRSEYSYFLSSNEKCGVSESESVVGSNPTVVPNSFCKSETTLTCPASCICDKNGVTSCTSVTENKEVVTYYKDLMDTIMENDTTISPEDKIEALKALRKQIDKTIADLIEQKKSIRYSDVKEISEKITVTRENIAVGESTTQAEGVTIESDIDGMNVTIASTSSTVTLSQDDVIVETGDLSIDTKGVNMDGVQVKLPPKAVLMRNHNLAANIQRVTEMKLEKEQNNVVYNIRYDANKKILGFIPASANQEIKINANTGEVISEKKPWWGFLASDIKSENVSNETS